MPVEQHEHDKRVVSKRFLSWIQVEGGVNYHRTDRSQGGHRKDRQSASHDELDRDEVDRGDSGEGEEESSLEAGALFIDGLRMHGRRQSRGGLCGHDQKQCYSDVSCQ